MRVHLVCILLVVGLVPLYAGMQIMKTLHWKQGYETRLEQIKEQGIALAGRIAQSGYLQQQMQPDITAQLQVLSSTFAGRIVLVNNSLVVVKDTAGREEGKTLISEEPICAMRGETKVYYNEEEGIAQVVMPISVGVTAESSGQVIGAMVLEGSLADVIAEHNLFQENTVVLMIGVAVLLLVVALVVSGVMTKSLRTLRGVSNK